MPQPELLFGKLQSHFHHLGVGGTRCHAYGGAENNNISQPGVKGSGEVYGCRSVSYMGPGDTEIECSTFTEKLKMSHIRRLTWCMILLNMMS